MNRRGREIVLKVVLRCARAERVERRRGGGEARGGLGDGGSNDSGRGCGDSATGGIEAAGRATAGRVIIVWLVIYNTKNYNNSTPHAPSYIWPSTICDFLKIEIPITL